MDGGEGGHDSPVTPAATGRGGRGGGDGVYENLLLVSDRENVEGNHDSPVYDNLKQACVCTRGGGSRIQLSLTACSTCSCVWSGVGWG